ncbi:MAG TPA: carbamoyltransferase HypF, partial [Betaproteobacteria bacterium]|nr:carbamoyltransferase HypF [Betaproteobacteria bacterium]
RRAATFRPFFLPGGERAAREPWRSGAALAWEAGLTWDDLPEGGALLHDAWRRRVNCFQTSAVDRLFDAAAALTGLLREASFEGQGGMWLEAACDGEAAPIALPLEKNGAGVWQSDWSSLLPLLLNGRRAAGEKAAVFHASLAHALLAQARAVRREHPIDAVGLSGGVFQNRRLTEQAVGLLAADGFTVRLARRLPCNDGGLCFGQLIEAGNG